MSVMTLAFTGFVILMAHPRLYWGAVGNDLTPPLIELPISRNYRHGGWVPDTPFSAQAGSPVSAIRIYNIFNENGWGRSLHFLAAWFLVVTGAVYLVAGIVTGHFRRHLVPHAGELKPRLFREDLVGHLQLRIRPARGGPPYGLVQKVAYCGVVFVAPPMMILTGLAIAPAITAGYPWLTGMFGGSQQERTIHFCFFALLVLFIVVLVLMVVLSGFRAQIRAMIFGKCHTERNTNCYAPRGPYRPCILRRPSGGRMFKIAAADLRQCPEDGQSADLQGPSVAVARALAGEGI